MSICSVAWAVTIGAAAVAVGTVSRSRALLAFGLESLVDGGASAVLVWRFRSERRDPDLAHRVEHLAARALGIALLVVAAYVAARSAQSLASGTGPQNSAAGLVLSGLSAVVLPPLAAWKLRLASRLGSAALRADGTLTAGGALLAAAAMAGLALHAVAGWNWADPAAALLIAAVLAREGIEALRRAARHTL